MARPAPAGVGDRSWSGWLPYNARAAPLARNQPRRAVALDAVKIDSPDFWFQMQIGMILGYFTAWPVNKWLVSNGIEEKMDHRRHLGMMLQQMADEQDDSDEPTARERQTARGAGQRQLSEQHTAQAAGVADDNQLPS